MKQAIDWKLWPKKAKKSCLLEQFKNNKKMARTRRNKKKKEQKINDRAKSLIKNGDVRVLVDMDIPAEAIAVLGRGLGFVPTPSPNNIELRLDARRVTNKITQHANHLERSKKNQNTQHDIVEIGETEETENIENTEKNEKNYTLPTKLYQPNYYQTQLYSTEPDFISALHHINTTANCRKIYVNKKQSANLTRLEERGFKWLQSKVSNSEICVCKADKGGVILIVPPEMLKNKIEEKVCNPDLYVELKTDPRYELYDNLIELWKDGKSRGFVSETEAKQIVGITEKGNKSTASRFKPGQTYFTASLKIHKMKPDHIKPGCDIPARLITCLQEGVTKRSDVYIAEQWLKELQTDYCQDLVKDTTDSLIWLEEMNVKAKQSSKNYSPFTFDFDSLYNSLSPSLVITALRDAMDTCRPTWSLNFKNWLLNLINLSIESAVGVFRGKFYRPKGGLPTGGSISVEAANITVFFVLLQTLYSDKNMMKEVVDIKRFVDDGAGIHIMTSRTFNAWKKVVSERVSLFGLKIKESDWSEPVQKHEPVNFLDILYSFDKNKNLQTDLYRKPTDSRQFLNFNSCHPNHTFSGVVYSQALRLRRIINNDERLAVRLDELKNDFRKCGYPQKLLNNIIKKVKTIKRSLENNKNETSERTDESIMVISTFGRDKKLTNILEKIETRTKNLKFKYIKKTAPSLNSLLTRPKNIALGNSFGKTLPCGRKKCQSCKLVSHKDKITGPRHKLLKTAKGNCITRNLIYHAKCCHCDKIYVGKTTQLLSTRISGHRNKYYECLKTIDGGSVTLSDEHLLGMHLFYNHKLRYTNAFNDGFKFTILEVSNPRNLDLKEHIWIQRLQCVVPYGLNSHDPFGIPLVL